MKKQLNIKDPSMTYFDDDTTTQGEQQGAAAAAGSSTRRGFKKREKRSERISLMVTPTTKEKLLNIAEETGTSLNDIVNQIFEDYLNQED